MKRKLPPHIVLPDGRWRFVKRRSTAAKARSAIRGTEMARRRRSFSRRHGGFGGGGLKSLLVPIGAGVADAYLNPKLPINGVGSTAIGMFARNETIKNIGLWQVGASIAGMIPVIGQGGNTGVWL
jgi:hypothetical protein